MAKKHLTGTVTLTKAGRIWDTYDLTLNFTKEVRATFQKNPERTMAQFLKRKGFKVNSIQFIKLKSIMNFVTRVCVLLWTNPP
jgi:hypothetical protein